MHLPRDAEGGVAAMPASGIARYGALVIVLLATTCLEARAGILGIATGVAPQANPAANLIANGGFESGAAGNQMWTGNGPYTGANTGGPGVSIPSWSASYPSGAYGWWGPLPMAAAPCAEGANCVYFGNWITAASQTPSFAANGIVTFPGPVAFTNTVPTNQGQVTLSQTVGLTPGATYLLDFWVTGEGPPSLPSGVFGLGIGTQSVFLEVTTGTRRYYVTFTADAAATPIAFTNWGHIQTGTGVTTELVLDDVILNRVPAPGGLTLCAVALAALAAARPRAARR